MSREWVDDAKRKPIDKRWVMRCDVGLFESRDRCGTTSEPSFQQPELWQFVAEGWFIADVHGDICPSCLSEGIEPRAGKTPHSLMSAGVSSQ